jgi:hypothetical protein
MDTINQKIATRKNALTKYFRALAKSYNNSLGNTMTYQAIIDTEENHFQLMKMGWYNDLYTFSVLIHLDINSETGNIWIQQNNTEIEIEEALAPFDITKKDLVLGFRPDYVREFSDFAVA